MVARPGIDPNFHPGKLTQLGELEMVQVQWEGPPYLLTLQMTAAKV
jgi:hypothetical protein